MQSPPRESSGIHSCLWVQHRYWWSKAQGLGAAAREEPDLLTRRDGKVSPVSARTIAPMHQCSQSHAGSARCCVLPEARHGQSLSDCLCDRGQEAVEASLRAVLRRPPTNALKCGLSVAARNHTASYRSRTGRPSMTSAGNRSASPRIRDSGRSAEPIPRSAHSWRAEYVIACPGYSLIGTRAFVNKARVAGASPHVPTVSTNVCPATSFRSTAAPRAALSPPPWMNRSGSR